MSKMSEIAASIEELCNAAAAINDVANWLQGSPAVECRRSTASQCDLEEEPSAENPGHTARFAPAQSGRKLTLIRHGSTVCREVLKDAKYAILSASSWPWSTVRRPRFVKPRGQGSDYAGLHRCPPLRVP